MPEIIVKETCPNCGKETVVYIERNDGERESGVMQFSGCQHCDKTLKNLTWNKKTWYLARGLKPKKAD